MSAVVTALLGATLLGAAAVRGIGDWDPAVLAILLALTIASDAIEIKFKRVTVSGNFLGITLAMALAGPAQAALLGVIPNALWAVRERPRYVFALVAVLAFSAPALIGGLAMHAAATTLGFDTHDIQFAIPLLVGFAIAHILNFAIVFVSAHIVDGANIRKLVRTVILPLLPSEVAMVILGSIVVYTQAHMGPVALGMLVVLLFLYLYLLKALVISQQRGEELTDRTEQLASLQVGVLTAMLRTLSMRDRMTARHSAAVARYARELAAAHGCTQKEQDLVHTAGLLHDIGKFILPDHILLADTKLSDEDWGLIKMHPYQGAKVVREMEGYGPVADIILCHHERIDGRGYPRGVAGDAIPIYSRMISIADTYDVMTSRDSYRDPVSSDAAIAELRRVSGTQLDGELVELFVQVLESKGVAFRHADDADFEAELQFERRMREHAAPRSLAAVA